MSFAKCLTVVAHGRFWVGAGALGRGAGGAALGATVGATGVAAVCVGCTSVWAFAGGDTTAGAPADRVGALSGIAETAPIPATTSPIKSTTMPPHLPQNAVHDFTSSPPCVCIDLRSTSCETPRRNQPRTRTCCCISLPTRLVANHQLPRPP